MFNILTAPWQVKSTAVFVTFYLSLGFGGGLATLDNNFGADLVLLNLAQIGSIISTTSTSSVPAATIKVISPNGGETFNPGDKVTISYQVAGLDNVRIVLRKNNLALTTLAQSTANTGTYTWTIPTNTTLGTDYKIRVRDALAGGTPKYFDDSDATFSIVAKATSTTPVSIPDVTKPVNTSTSSVPVATEPAKAVLTTPATPIPVTHIAIGKTANTKLGTVQGQTSGLQHCTTQGTVTNRGTCCLGKNLGTSGGYCAGFVPGITPMPAYAIDGNISATSLWCSATQLNSINKNDWYQIDLGAPTSIDSTKITFANIGTTYACARATDYQIQTSNDKVTWTTVATVASNTSDTINHVLATKPTARYVRIYTTKVLDNTGYRMGIREFEVYQATTTETGGPVEPVINSISPSQTTYTGSNISLALNGVGFTAENFIYLDSGRLPTPIASTNNGAKVTVSIPSWVTPGSHQISLSNENGFTDFKTFNIAAPANGYLIARTGGGNAAFTTQPQVSNGIAKTGPSQWFANAKNWVAAVLNSTTNAVQSGTPGNVILEIENGDSVDFKWDFPNDNIYTACYKAGGTTTIPLLVDPNQRVVMGDEDFRTYPTEFGVNMGTTKAPHSLENFNQGSYTTGPLKRPVGAVTTATTSISFSVNCAETHSSDPTKALWEPRNSGGLFPVPWPAVWKSIASYNVTVKIKPTPWEKCERDFPKIARELFDGPFPVNITEDSFGLWGNPPFLDEGSISYIPSHKKYDASGGHENISNAMVTAQRCGLANNFSQLSGQRRFVGEDALKEIKTRTDLYLPQGLMVMFLGEAPAGGYYIKPEGHAMVALQVVSYVENGEQVYEVKILDPNGPKVRVLEFKEERLAIMATSTADVALFSDYVYTSQLYNDKVIPVRGGGGGGRLPADTAFCQQEANRDSDYCLRKPNLWLEENYPLISNPTVDKGNCAGWTDFVLSVAYEGNFVDECPTPKL